MPGLCENRRQMASGVESQRGSRPRLPRKHGALCASTRSGASRPSVPQVPRKPPHHSAWVSTIPRFQLAPSPVDGTIHRLSGCTDPTSQPVAADPGNMRAATQYPCPALVVPATADRDHALQERDDLQGFQVWIPTILSQDPAPRSTSHDTSTHPEFLNRKYHLEPCPCRACSVVRWPSFRRYRHSNRHSRRQPP
jgi:hypothetical protein